MYQIDGLCLGSFHFLVNLRTQKWLCCTVRSKTFHQVKTQKKIMLNRKQNMLVEEAVVSDKLYRAIC